MARGNIERAGLGEVVDLRVGPALDDAAAAGSGGRRPVRPRPSSTPTRSTRPDYFAWALEHSRPGSLIVADNVVRGGALADADSDDPAIQAQRRFHEMLAAEPRVTATTIQTVGGKGYDGFT